MPSRRRCWPRLGQETQARSGTEHRLVGIGNPLPENAEAEEYRPGSLQHAKAELESVAEMLPGDATNTVRARGDSPGTAGRVARRELGPSLLPRSFSPGRSAGIRLAVDRRGTDLARHHAAGFTALDAAKLIVLSACQTAVQDFRALPDEAIGLPAGLTQAGVPAVLGRCGASTMPARRC